VEEVLCVEASILPLMLRVVLRAFSSSLLYLRLYIGCRAHRRILGRREGYASPFVVANRMYILPLCSGRGDPQGRR
jgi:hypothetical protein